MIDKQYNVIGAIRSPLFKTGILSPVLTDGNICFELGAFKIYRITQEQFENSVMAGIMVRFDSPILFPGMWQDAVNSTDEYNPYRRGYSLLYVSDELESDLRIKLVAGISSDTIQWKQGGYNYYLLSDVERQRVCKLIFSDYEKLIRERLIGELLKAPSRLNNPESLLPFPINADTKNTLKDDCAALLGIASDPDDVKKVLPLFLLLDGQDGWKEEDWKGLYFWAEDYGRRMGVDSAFDTRKWEEERSAVWQELIKQSTPA